MLFTKEEEITLSNLGDGELERQFQIQLRKIMLNIQDTETTDDVRELQIIIKFKPNAEQRGMINIGYGFKRKEASNKPVVTAATIEHGSKGLTMKEWTQTKQKPLMFPQKAENGGEDA